MSDARQREVDLLATLRPEARQLALAWMESCQRNGHNVVLVQARREPIDQAVLYCVGRRYLGAGPHGGGPGRDLCERVNFGRWGRAVGADGKPAAIKTKARPFEAPHCYAAAWDFAFLLNGRLVSPALGAIDSWHASHPWRAVAMLGEALGLESGAHFGETAPGAYDGWDAGHLQLRNWQSLADWSPRT